MKQKGVGKESMPAAAKPTSFNLGEWFHAAQKASWYKVRMMEEHRNIQESCLDGGVPQYMPQF